MVLKKGKDDNKILFLDATAECIKVTNNNRLTYENIGRIVDVFASRTDVEHFSRLVPYDEVKENAYNLSVSTYVEQKDTREKIDIVKLNAEIKEIVAREQVLRESIDKIIEEIEGGEDNVYVLENLDPSETRKFVENTFREEEIKTVIDRLMTYFEKFYGMGNARFRA